MTSPPIYHRCRVCRYENSFIGEPEEYECKNCGLINRVCHIGTIRFVSYIKCGKSK